MVWPLNSNIPPSLPKQDSPSPKDTKENLTEDVKVEIRNSHSTLDVTSDFEGIEHKTAHFFIIIYSIFEPKLLTAKKLINIESHGG